MFITLGRRLPTTAGMRSVTRIARRSISWTYGRNERDPYQTIKSQPQEVIGQLSDMLEQRASETKQRQLRAELLGGLVGDVCEVGTGTGAVARDVARMSGVKSVVGVDPSPAFLEKARANMTDAQKESYVEGEATALPLADASVDSVILWTTLIHIPETEHGAALAEAKRVLKPGGTIHLFDNDPVGWNFRMFEHDPLNAPVQAWIDAVVPDKYTMRRAPKILTHAGFDVKPLRLLTIIDNSADSYGYWFVKRAINEYAGTKTCGTPMIQAMLNEAERRVKNGEFQMGLSYGYLAGTKSAR